MKCCEMQPYKIHECVKVQDHPVPAGVIAAVIGITALVLSLLSVIGIITLPPLATFGLTMLGGGILVAMGFLAGLFMPDSKIAKVATVIIELIAAGAIVCGALGLCGYLPILSGTTGIAMIGGGAVLLVTNWGPCCLNYPYDLNS